VQQYVTTPGNILYLHSKKKKEKEGEGKQEKQKQEKQKQEKQKQEEQKDEVEEEEVIVSENLKFVTKMEELDDGAAFCQKESDSNIKIADVFLEKGDIVYAINATVASTHKLAPSVREIQTQVEAKGKKLVLVYAVPQHFLRAKFFPPKTELTVKVLHFSMDPSHKMWKKWKGTVDKEWEDVKKKLLEINEKKKKKIITQHEQNNRKTE